jgi:cardiolipin hydrolase
MSNDTSSIKNLIEIFERTFADKSFSRSEKKAVSQLLEEDYSLNEDDRQLLRSKVFDIARQGIPGYQEKAALDWLETANKLLIRRGDNLVCFSPGYQCRQLIVDQLNNALTSVDICVFTISDNSITSAIRQCMEQGIQIRIITDDEKVDDHGSDIKRLAAAGIEVRIDNSVNHMHHKFALFDNRRVLTGSYNWTRSAADDNQENILLTDDKRAVAAYRDEFEKLWAAMNQLVI